MRVRPRVGFGGEEDFLMPSREVIYTSRQPVA